MPIDPEAARDFAAAYTAAWNTGSPEAVAAFYAADGQIIINRGKPWVGRSGVTAMAAGFFADVPDLNLICEQVRCAGDHVAYCWAFTGHHVETKNPLRIIGWEEWDFDADEKVRSSLGWYDAEDYRRQVHGS